MRRRIAHRPRYRNTQQFARPLQRFRQQFFRTRWTYRHSTHYEKRSPGYSLSLLPAGYAFVSSAFARGR